jgi:hypothetical protein
VLPVPATATTTHFTRSLAQVRDAKNFDTQDVWFSSNAPRLFPEGLSQHDLQGQDEKTVKLGKTIRILHERLPSLLASPLPQEILSPRITLNLFPSTHPHLPTVSGRIAYTAALWTAPVAWGRLPVLGNVKLDILSERLVKYGGTSTAGNFRNHRLIVRWKTCPGNKLKNGSESVLKLAGYYGPQKKKDTGAFCGLFIFEFDEEGRILTHTIEHVDEGGSWEQPHRVINVTDWLLGKAWGKRDDEGGLALHAEYCKDGPSREMDHLRHRR